MSGGQAAGLLGSQSQIPQVPQAPGYGMSGLSRFAQPAVPRMSFRPGNYQPLPRSPVDMPRWMPQPIGDRTGAPGLNPDPFTLAGNGGSGGVAGFGGDGGMGGEGGGGK